MTPTTRPAGDPEAMAEILASIRRIVADDARRPSPPPGRPSHDAGDAVLVLTPAMRVDAGREDRPADTVLAGRLSAHTASEPAVARHLAASQGTLATLDPDMLSVDEAVIADIARAIVREELEGELGARLSAGIRAIVKQEVQRAVAARD